ncbi:hypothetical protein BDV11DRAFT_75668 [Aspergillus similis]
MGCQWWRGEHLRTKEWLKCLRSYVGDGTREFQGMLRGSVLDLSDTIVIHEGWNLTPTIQEILEFGFHKTSIN